MKPAGGAATEPDGQGGVLLVADRSYYFYEGEDLICQQDVGALIQDDSQYEPKFLLLDHLGSTRAELLFDPVSLAPQIQEYYDLMPYGEVIDPPTTQESVLFTGKQRDIESGLDEFGNRKFVYNLYRWSSPDQIFNDNQIETPQSWNLFAYVRNNPINLIDPTGEAIYYTHSVLEALDNAARSLSPTHNQTLSQFEGPDAPNVLVGFGDAGKDPNGRNALGIANCRLDLSSTIYGTLEDPNAVIQVPESLASANIVLDLDENGNDPQRGIDVLLHEWGHVDDANNNTTEFRTDFERTQQSQGRTVHDRRPEERRANGYRDRVKDEMQNTQRRERESERERVRQEREAQRQNR